MLSFYFLFKHVIIIVTKESTFHNVSHVNILASSMPFIIIVSQPSKFKQPTLKPTKKAFFLVVCLFVFVWVGCFSSIVAHTLHARHHPTMIVGNYPCELWPPCYTHSLEVAMAVAMIHLVLENNCSSSNGLTMESIQSCANP